MWGHQMAVVGMDGHTKRKGGGGCGHAKWAMEDADEELGRVVVSSG